jgi:hypothetical protein
MIRGDLIVWWLLGVTAFGCLAAGGFQWSRTRVRRRRRKSHSPIVSKSRRPTVRFSVKPPKDE